MRLMSFCTRPMVAAKNAVVAPMNITKACAFGASSNSGDNRATMNANHTTRFAKLVEVASYGLQSDAEMSGKILDCDPSRLAQEGDDLRLPLARSRLRN